MCDSCHQCSGKVLDGVLPVPPVLTAGVIDVPLVTATVLDGVPPVPPVLTDMQIPLLPLVTTAMVLDGAPPVPPVPTAMVLDGVPPVPPVPQVSDGVPPVPPAVIQVTGSEVILPPVTTAMVLDGAPPVTPDLVPVIDIVIATQPIADGLWFPWPAWPTPQVSDGVPAETATIGPLAGNAGEQFVETECIAHMCRY